jgi:hypothetical protein
MNGHITAAVAATRNRDLRRAAGCCTPVPEHGRALARAARGRLRVSTLRPRSPEPISCCA